MSLGAQGKNTICFIKGSLAYLSAVHRDLNNPADLLRFKKDVEYFLKKRPEIIAYDLHPEYQSSKLVQQLYAKSYTLKAIQHHHANIAYCMADNGLKNQKVIGVAFDGTGLGDDNRLWGGEFLICDYKNFKRKAHLEEVPLLGEERDITEQWRLTAAWLHHSYPDGFLGLKVDFTKGLDKNKWVVLKDMYSKDINAPLSSSMGRLFDAAASLILARYKASFEAELARELEGLARKYNSPASTYRFRIYKKQGSYIIEPSPAFQEIVKDLRAKEPKSKIAYKFHLTIAQIMRRLCLLLKRDSGINNVVLSGGVFKNNLLLGLALDLLYKEGFRVFRHQSLSCSDSALSLGQAVIAGLSRG